MPPTTTLGSATHIPHSSTLWLLLTLARCFHTISIQSIRDIHRQAVQQRSPRREERRQPRSMCAHRSTELITTADVRTVQRDPVHGQGIRIDGQNEFSVKPHTLDCKKRVLECRMSSLASTRATDTHRHTHRHTRNSSKGMTNESRQGWLEAYHAEATNEGVLNVEQTSRNIINPMNLHRSKNLF